ncbi:hypothetical protein Droror1_Dr00009569 [Drosera rotundifolia]
MRRQFWRQFSTSPNHPYSPPLYRNPTAELHANLIKTQTHTNPSSSISAVLRSYTLSSTTLSKSELVFARIKNPTVLLFNYMIQGFSQLDDPRKSIGLYTELRRRGLRPNHLTMIFLLKGCGRGTEIWSGRMVHCEVVKFGFYRYFYVGNCLVHMYCLCGELGSARQVFDEMLVRDLVSWNSMICGYAQWGRFGDVLGLFGLMRGAEVRADEVTVMKVVSACSHFGDWELADEMVKYVEEEGVEVNVYLGNTLIDMYGRRGLVELAQRMFDGMWEKNVVSWNALITGQAKVGSLEQARRLFDEMPKRDVVSWTSMITGYSQGGKFKEAIELFHAMLDAKVQPDENTIATVLSACAHLGILDEGEKVHSLINKHHIRTDIHVWNALIDMYSKCGSVEQAIEVFQDMTEKDSVSWTSIISGLAVNGFAKPAVELFERMLSENIRPTYGTFVGVLLACAHAGMVDKGLGYFESMEQVHGLVPLMKHYGCVIDLFSRSGKLERAYQFIEAMPIPADAVLWRILLGACKLNGNLALAEIATNKLLESDPHNSVNYVLLSNTYAGAERWDAATRLRDLMEDGNAQKPLGSSSL